MVSSYFPYGILRAGTRLRIKNIQYQNLNKEKIVVSIRKSKIYINYGQKKYRSYKITTGNIVEFQSIRKFLKRKSFQIPKNYFFK